MSDGNDTIGLEQTGSTMNTERLKKESGQGQVNTANLLPENGARKSSGLFSRLSRLERPIQLEKPPLSATSLHLGPQIEALQKEKAHQKYLDELTESVNQQVDELHRQRQEENTDHNKILAIQDRMDLEEDDDGSGLSQALDQKEEGDGKIVQISEKRKSKKIPKWLINTAAGLLAFFTLNGAVKNVENAHADTGPGIYGPTTPKIVDGKRVIEKRASIPAKAQITSSQNRLSNVETLAVPTSSFYVSNWDVDKDTGKVSVLASYTYPGEKHLLVGNLDVSGNIQLTDTGLLPNLFYALDTTISQTDPNIIVTVGDDTAANRGALLISKDGDTTAENQSNNGGTYYDAKISSDNKFVFFSEADPNNNNTATLFRYEIATKQFNKVTVPVGFPGVSYMTDVKATGPNTYKFFSYIDGQYGYYEMNILADGSVSPTLVDAGEGYSCGELTEFIRQGKQWVGLIDSGTMGKGSNDPNRWASTAYFALDNVMTYEIQANHAFYETAQPNYLSLDISSVVRDEQSDTLFMLVAVNVNNVLYPHVEAVPLSDPNNISLRKLLPENGSWPTIGSHGGVNYTMNIMNVSGQKYLLLDVVSDDPNKSGMRMANITNGFNSLNWTEVTRIPPTPPTPTVTPIPPTETPTPIVTPVPPTPTPSLYQNFLPVIKKVFPGGW